MKKVKLFLFCVLILSICFYITNFFNPKAMTHAYAICDWSNIAKDEVVFNTNSHIYHGKNCEWAMRCTVNCVKMKRSRAAIIGRPCRVCNGY